MNLSTPLTEPKKLDAREDLLARLDRAVAVAQDIERQAKAMCDMVAEFHSEPLAA